MFFCNYDAFGIIVYYSQLHTYHQIIIGSIQAFGWLLKVMVSHWNFSVGFMYFPSSFQNLNSSFKNYFCDFYLVGQKNEKSQIDTLCKQFDFIYSGKKKLSVKSWNEGAAKLKKVIGNSIWQYILSSKIC